MLTTGPTDHLADDRGRVLLLREALTEESAAGSTPGAVVLRAEQGYGKTIAVHQAAEHRGAVLVCVPCAEADGKASRLLELVVEAVESALGDDRGLSEAPPAAPSAARARTLLAALARVDRPAVVFFEDAGALRAAEREALGSSRPSSPGRALTSRSRSPRGGRSDCERQSCAPPAAWPSWAPASSPSTPRSAPRFSPRTGRRSRASRRWRRS